jgi:hypothetical protein
VPAIAFRYEVSACAKLVGGYTFQYATRDGSMATPSVQKAQWQAPVPAQMQLAALNQVCVGGLFAALSY